jgi:light-regulated signal transduction histidine kinase (bacteriophytochrome)
VIEICVSPILISLGSLSRGTPKDICRRRALQLNGAYFTMRPGPDRRSDSDYARDAQNPLKVKIPRTREIDGNLSPKDDTRDPSRSPDASPKEGKPPRLESTDVHTGFVPSQGFDGAASAWSTSSDKQLGFNSPNANQDRVFPIRSVVSVDSSQTPYIGMPGRNSGDQGDYFPSGGVPPWAAGNDIAVNAAMRRRQSQSTNGSEIHSASTPRKESREIRPPEEPPRPSRRFSNSGLRRPENNNDRYGGGARMQIFGDAGSDKSTELSGHSSLKNYKDTNSQGTGASVDGDSISGLVTARFKHIVTAEGHAVITGRDGDTLQRCEDEPIHIPGAIQGFGLLIALEEQESGEFIVRVVSENSKAIIGFTPQELFKLKNFSDILSDEQAENLLDHVDFIRDEEADPANNGPEVFTLAIRSPRPPKRNQKLWCGMHIHPSYPDLIVCEFELDDDPVHPLVPPEDAVPESPEDTLHSNPTHEEYNESTSITSKPLRVLRSARKRKGEAAAMAVFNIMSQVQEQLASAPNLDTFLKILVGVVKELTGFHRVMIYQFDSTFNGRVVTELVDPRATKDLYKGLNFPASDIPKQARDLYKVNRVRLLYDRDLETARLVCRSIEDLERPLDLSFSYLRAMSPIHIKYLANMAVRSSMSISINAFSELWGLIACHSYGNKGMRVSFPIRKMCRLIGDTASRNIERLSYASRLQARKLINTVPTEANPSGYIIASSEDLLKLFDADFGLLSIQGETKIMGKLEQTQEALAMLEYLRLRQYTSVITSQDIKGDFPDLRYPPGFTIIAGLLLVPLSVGGTDFIVFLRKGQIKEVKWAGNPYEKFVKEGTEGYLEPRKSFKTWSETVVGKCREWTEEQVETAAVLCLVYGKFIEVWRQKEAALQNSQLTRLLLANSAHEVRTPLNAIINYLEIALEGALDQETRDNLAKSHSASKSLIYVINDLLDLTKTEEGQDLIKDEVFDLPATVREATESFRGDAKRKGLEYESIEHPGVPQLVHGDQRRVRQAVANIIANAVQHTDQGWIHVEIWGQDVSDGRANVEIIVQDSGAGMSNEKLDALFRDLEQVSTAELDISLDGSEDTSRSAIAQQTEGRALGLGLAMVARIVRNMDGQLRLKSEEGKGSRFVVQLPFLLPDAEPDRTEGSTKKDNLSLPPVSTPPSQAEEGEVTLIDRGSSIRSEGIIRKQSAEGMSSLRSFKSGSSNKSAQSNRSEADRLIDAISGSIAQGEPETQGLSLHRSNSKGSVQSRRSAGSLGTNSHRTSNPTTNKPGALRRSKSYGAPGHLSSHMEGPPGSEYITDNRTLMRAVRMPDDFEPSDEQENAPSHSATRVSFNVPQAGEEPAPTKIEPLDAKSLQVLVAEDDPVNIKIIQKRLEKSGHYVHHTINGEDCASAYGEKTKFFDVVLMDMQVSLQESALLHYPC